MKLNHLNLTVTDVLALYVFLQKYFGFKDYGALKASEAVGFLSDDNGMVLALFRGNGEVKYPSGFHIGFVQTSEAQVNQINENLRKDGHDVSKPSRMHGSWTFYFHAPGGIMIEVLC